MFKPIDDLIEHLKSSKPYGQNEALKLWEALKRLSTCCEGGSGVSSGVSSGGGGPASHIGTIDQLVIGGTCFSTYDPSWYGALAVREYATIFDQITCRQILGLFVDKGVPNRVRIFAGKVGAVAQLPLSLEIGDQQTTPALYISVNSRIALGFISPTAILHLKAGTAAASTAPLKFTAGVLLTSPELGALEFTDDGTTATLYATVRIGTVVTRVPIVPPTGVNVGTAILDFGAFPGTSDASIAITGQTTIVAGSVVNAWIRPVASADHSADEHLVETLKIVAGNIVAGTGFTIYGFNSNQINDPSGPSPRIYGQWNVNWSWS